MRKYASVVLALCQLIAGVMPARAQASVRPTAEVERRVESILEQLTLEEKIDLLGGVDDFFVRGVPRLGLPRLKMADGPLGVRNFGPATAYAGGIALAAAWDVDLARRVGVELGRDARAKGVHFLLGPGVNIYRAPLNGRNFEYFGEDPFLASRIAVAYINGVQSQGVAATIKHFMGNNSEFDRHNTNAVIDERAMREIYLPTFEAAVREARVGAIMDAYNLVNGAHATENGHLNTEIAKREWGFDGLIMSDWVATCDAVAAANGGLDLEMPSGAHFNRAQLLPALRAGQVSAATIDDKVRRILRTAIRFGWLDREQSDLAIPRPSRAGRRVALEAARAGVVLLKNEGGVLPFDRRRIKSVLVVGPGAHPAIPVGGGSARVEPFTAVSLLEGLSDHLSADVRVYYARGVPPLAELAEATNFTTTATAGQTGVQAEYFNNRDLQGLPAITRTEPHINFSRQARSFPEQTRAARWAGYYRARGAGDYELFAASAGEDNGFYRLLVDDRLIFDNWTTARALVSVTTLALADGAHKITLEQHAGSGRMGTRMQLGIVAPGAATDPDALRLAARSDVVVVAAGFDPGSEAEGADRTFRLPVGQDELIRAMAAANKRTVVILTSGGGVDMRAWFDRVPALLQAWYAGEQGGTALAEVLFGDVNPSGRLPVTFERRWEDNPTHDSYYPADGTRRVEYRESIFVGYRGYERKGIRPLFPFGHGLSYTTFAYGDLAIKPAASRAPPQYKVSFDVKNTGARAGAEVAQVYVGARAARAPRPAKELKGFVKVSLRAGETRRVSVTLAGRAFAYYDAEAKQWRADPGTYDVLVGRSSEQIELRGKVNLPSISAAAIH